MTDNENRENRENIKPAEGQKKDKAQAGARRRPVRRTAQPGQAAAQEPAAPRKSGTVRKPRVSAPVSRNQEEAKASPCLLYTSDAADE